MHGLAGPSLRQPALHDFDVLHPFVLSQWRRFHGGVCGRFCSLLVLRLTAPPLYAVLTLLGLDEWPEIGHVSPPPDGLGDATSDFAAPL